MVTVITNFSFDFRELYEILCCTNMSSLLEKNELIISSDNTTHNNIYLRYYKIIFKKPLS